MKSQEVPPHIKSDKGLFWKSKLHVPSMITFYKSVDNTTTNKQTKNNQKQNPTITCTFQINAPLETFSGEMGGRTFSFFFVDLRIPGKTKCHS